MFCLNYGLINTGPKYWIRQNWRVSTQAFPRIFHGFPVVIANQIIYGVNFIFMVLIICLTLYLLVSTTVSAIVLITDGLFMLVWFKGKSLRILLSQEQFITTLQFLCPVLYIIVLSQYTVISKKTKFKSTVISR